MRTLSSISLLLGVCSPVSAFSIPLLIGFGESHTALRLFSLAPAGMMLAGFALALAAKRRGEEGRLTSTALAWNSLLLIVYVVMFIALLVNPVSPS